MKFPKTILLYIGQILLIAFLGFLARESWRIYGEQKKTARVNKTGMRVLVRLDKVSHEKRTWRDQLGNSRYIYFPYQGKAYSMRYTQDTLFLEKGAIVPVIYSPSTDEFIQPGKTLHQMQLYKTSPLVRWSVVRLFSGPDTALFFFVLLAAVLLLLATGFLANLTGIFLIRKLGDLLVFICAIGGAVYLTYDAASYWRYYSNLRHQASHETVRVEDIERQAAVNDNSTVLVLYVYQARVSFRQESRIIAVGESDYTHARPGDTLDVLYDPVKDDMMSVNHTLSYHILIFPLIIWALLLFFFNRRRKSWLKGN